MADHRITAEKPVDLMMDLRERMVRIETKLDLRVDKDLETDIAIASNQLRITALETEGTVLKAQIKTLKWLGAAAITLVTLLGDSLTRFVS